MGIPSFVSMTISPKENAISVTCIILFLNGKVLAAQRSEKMQLPLLWEFPGGKVENGETEEACIVREIREELGIEIETVDKLQVFVHSYSATKVIRLIPFLGFRKSGKINLSEHIQVIWLSRSELEAVDWAPADFPIVGHLERYWDTYHKKVFNFQNKS